MAARPTIFQLPPRGLMNAAGGVPRLMPVKGVNPSVSSALQALLYPALQRVLLANERLNLRCCLYGGFAGATITAARAREELVSLSMRIAPSPPAAEVVSVNTHEAANDGHRQADYYMWLLGWDFEPGVLQQRLMLEALAHTRLRVLMGLLRDGSTNTWNSSWLV